MDVKHRVVVEILLDKAASAGDAAQAINFAQAACNAAMGTRRRWLSFECQQERSLPQVSISPRP